MKSPCTQLARDEQNSSIHVIRSTCLDLNGARVVRTELLSRCKVSTFSCMRAEDRQPIAPSGAWSVLKRSREARALFLYGALGGVLYGAIQFAEVIARKSLGVSALEITLFTMIMPVVSLTSIWWGRILMGRDQRALILVTGFIGMGALLSGYWLVSMIHLYILAILYFMAYAIQAPAQNRVFQQYIPSKATGGLFGLGQGVRMVFVGATSAMAGWWLDRAEQGWQHVFLIAGLTGFVSIVALGVVRTQKQHDALPIRFNIILGPLRDAWRLLKRRPDFMRFEGSFMVYGVAFMMTLPVLPIYLVDDLMLDYGQIGLARGTVYSIIMIAGVPLFGRWFDKTTPHRFGAISFGILTGFPLLLIGAYYLEGSPKLFLVIAAFVLFGIGMSGVMILWNLGSMRFAGAREDAGHYQALHLAATGIRGLFAPLLGYVVMEMLGTRFALACAAAIWALSAVSMLLARVVDIRSGIATPLRALDTEE